MHSLLLFVAVTGSASSDLSPQCSSALSILRAAPDYLQAVDTITRTFDNQVGPRADAACAARAKPCPWNASSHTATCMNQSAYTFPNKNTTACFFQAYALWDQFADVVTAMEKEANKSLAPGGGHNWWHNPAIATHTSGTATTFRSMTLARPIFLPNACYDEPDVMEIIGGLNKACRANRRHIYCNIGLQYYPNPTTSNT